MDNKRNELFIKTIIEKTDRCAAFLKHINGREFNTDSTTNVYNSLQTYYVENGNIPSLETMRDLGIITSDTNEFFNDGIFKKVLSDDVYDAIITAMDKFFKIVVNEEFNTLVKNNGDAVVGFQTYQEKMSELDITEDNAPTDLNVLRNNEYNSLLFSPRDKLGLLPTYYDDIDEALSGGFKRNSINMFVAGTGVGKSQMMTNIAVKQVQNGKNILYLSLEESLDDCLTRITGIRTGFPVSPSENGFVDDVREFLDADDVNQEEQGYYIVETFFEKTTANLRCRIQSAVDALEKENKQLDAVFIDYFGLLKPAVINKNDGLYETGKSVVNTLKKIVEDFDTTLISACQTNRPATKLSLRELALDNVSESFAINQTCSTVIALGIEEDDKEWEDEMHLSFLKRRVQLTEGFIRLLADTKSLRFYDLSEEDEWKTDAVKSGCDVREKCEYQQTNDKLKQEDKKSKKEFFNYT